jgi:DNA-binding Xre family transcriptional regulator
VRGRLRQQLSSYLRKRRGAQTYAEFSKEVGISTSTLQRLEVGTQNITIDTLEHIAHRLKCRIGDIFP